MANPEHLAILKQGVEAWNAWREENPEIEPELWEVDLQGADLQGADLDDANLDDARLDRARLDGASLDRTSLQGARLNHASLVGTSLVGAHLDDARLDDASFVRARLRGARLHRARLDRAQLDHASLDRASFGGAHLDDASLGWTAIADVDLSQCKGLETVEHVGPSNIATKTLERTAEGLANDPSLRGMIETFFRGAGVPEDLLTDWFALRIANPIEFYSCFISYSHEDKSFARRLYAGLQAHGIRCWLDEKDLRPGDVMIDAITNAIRLRDKVVLCCSLASLTSGWVDQELAAALEIERRKAKKIIIPLDLDGFLFDGWEGGKAPLVRERVAADFTGWESDNAKFEAQFERMVKALRTGDGGSRGAAEAEAKM